MKFFILALLISCMADTTSPLSGRHWLFTLPYPTPLPEEADSFLASLGDDVDYAVYQVEFVDDPLRQDHAQGYVEFRNVKGLESVRRLLPRAHWDLRYSSRDDARGYCTKESFRFCGPYETGLWRPSSNVGASSVDSDV